MTPPRALSLALGLDVTLAAGLRARSVALLADAADFVADSVIYALALHLGGRERVDARRYGLPIAGLMAPPGLVALGTLVARWRDGAAPDGQTILQVSLLALVATLASALVIGLAVRARAEGGGPGFRAASLSSRNDAPANVARIGAGAAVATIGRGWPDTRVGVDVAILHFPGAADVARTATERRPTA